MRIEQLDPADEKVARACYDVMLAAHEVDEPVEPPTSYGRSPSTSARAGRRRQARSGAPLTRKGRSTGSTGCTCPTSRTLTGRTGGPVVHPAVRRRGIGREMLRHEGAGRRRTGGRCSAPRRPRAPPETRSRRRSGRGWTLRRSGASSTCARSRRGRSRRCARRPRRQPPATRSVLDRAHPRRVLRPAGRGIQRVQRRATRRERGAGNLGRQARPRADGDRRASRAAARLQRRRVPRHDR